MITVLNFLARYDINKKSRCQLRAVITNIARLHRAPQQFSEVIRKCKDWYNRNTYTGAIPSNIPLFTQSSLPLSQLGFLPSRCSSYFLLSALALFHNLVSVILCL